MPRCAPTPSSTGQGMPAEQDALRQPCDRLPAESLRLELAQQLLDLCTRHPLHQRLVQRYLSLLQAPNAFVRDRAGGHFTGSAWLVSADGSRVLLTHHRKLGRWLQLGGHADGDENLAAVALREAEEESGLTGLSAEHAIFDIDSHRIPLRGDVRAHWHHDVRYVIRAGTDERFRVSAESLALAWVPIRELLVAPGTDVSMRRMARRWLAGGASCSS